MAVAGRTMHKEAFMFTAWECLSQTQSNIYNGKPEKHSEDAHLHQGQFMHSIDTRLQNVGGFSIKAPWLWSVDNQRSESL